MCQSSDWSVHQSPKNDFPFKIFPGPLQLLSLPPSVQVDQMTLGLNISPGLFLLVPISSRQRFPSVYMMSLAYLASPSVFELQISPSS